MNYYFKNSLSYILEAIHKSKFYSVELLSLTLYLLLKIPLMPFRKNNLSWYFWYENVISSKDYERPDNEIYQNENTIPHRTIFCCANEPRAKT